MRTGQRTSVLHYTTSLNWWWVCDRRWHFLRMLLQWAGAAALRAETSKMLLLLLLLLVLPSNPLPYIGRNRHVNTLGPSWWREVLLSCISFVFLHDMTVLQPRGFLSTSTETAPRPLGCWILLGFPFFPLSYASHKSYRVWKTLGSVISLSLFHGNFHFLEKFYIPLWHYHSVGCVDEGKPLPGCTEPLRIM